MVYFDDSVYNLSKEFSSSNSMNEENLFTLLYKNKEKKTKRRIFSISTSFKLLAMLFLIFLYLVNIYKEENHTTSIVNFNKGHTRFLAESEPLIKNKKSYNDKLMKQFDDIFNDMESLVLNRLSHKWEVFLRKLEIENPMKWKLIQEKYMSVLHVLNKNFEDFYSKTLEEYEKLNEKFPSKKEYSKFFDRKIRELYKLREEEYKYIKKCMKEYEKAWRKL